MSNNTVAVHFQARLIEAEAHITARDLEIERLRALVRAGWEEGYRSGWDHKRGYGLGTQSPTDSMWKHSDIRKKL
jgi:hypothetical protein